MTFEPFLFPLPDDVCLLGQYLTDIEEDFRQTLPYWQLIFMRIGYNTHPGMFAVSFIAYRLLPYRDPIGDDTLPEIDIHLGEELCVYYPDAYSGTEARLVVDALRRAVDSAWQKVGAR